MLKRCCFILLAGMVLVQPVFADEEACAPIVKACVDAGYGNGNEPKQFWTNCMEPLILGKKVDKTTVSDDVVKACRTAKIKELKEELAKMEKANS